jgi:hypothetical protein
MYVGNDLRRRTLDVTSETNRRTRPVSKNADRASGGQSYDCLDISGAHAGISKAVRYRYRIVDSLAASRSVTPITNSPRKRHEQYMSQHWTAARR